MKKEDAMKWIEALRSSQYKQGKSYLYIEEDNSYCCLGVLNSLFPNLLLSGGSNNVLHNFSKIGLLSDHGNFHDSSLGLTGLNDVGLHESHPENLTKDFTNESFTFDEIADIIQLEYVEGL